MARIEIDGIGIAYDIIGDGAKTAVLTQGGRFSKDTPGVRALAEKLAEGGLRVLIWDRPNCGESDISFAGASESTMHADVLAGLLRALKMEPALVVGGSAGARVSLLTAIRNPDVVERLFVFWISGGAATLASLAHTYASESMIAAGMGGMEAVASLPGWREPLERNSGNRDRLLSHETQTFIDTMERWADAFLPKESMPFAGISASDLNGLSMPVMVLRSGQSDIHHPRATSEKVHAMIPGALIAEPPWGDREWMDRMIAQTRGEGLFARWPLLAPQILAFAKS